MPLALLAAATTTQDPATTAGRGVILLFAVAMLGFAIATALAFWAALRHRRRLAQRPRHRGTPDGPDPWAEAGRRAAPPDPDDEATDIITPDDRGPRTP